MPTITVTRGALLRRATAALLLGAYVVSATGCTGWHNQQGDVATIVAPPPKASPDAPAPPAGVPGLAQQPVSTQGSQGVRELRVTTATHGTIELHDPRVANDSLYGLVKKNGPEVGFPVAEVTSVQTRGSNAGGTVVLVVGVAALTFGVLVAATAAGMCDFGC